MAKTNKEIWSNFKFSGHPYLTIIGELSGVFGEYTEELWHWAIESVQHCVCIVCWKEWVSDLSLTVFLGEILQLGGDGWMFCIIYVMSVKQKEKHIFYHKKIHLLKHDQIEWHFHDHDKRIIMSSFDTIFVETGLHLVYSFSQFQFVEKCACL